METPLNRVVILLGSQGSHSLGMLVEWKPALATPTPRYESEFPLAGNVVVGDRT